MGLPKKEEQKKTTPYRNKPIEKFFVPLKVVGWQVKIKRSCFSNRAK
jgi:hypothetical protein